MANSLELAVDYHTLIKKGKISLLRIMALTTRVTFLSEDYNMRIRLSPKIPIAIDIPINILMPSELVLKDLSVRFTRQMLVQ